MWVNLLIGIIFNAIAYLLTPRPEPQTVKPDKDIQGPRAVEGKELGKVYGTVWIKDPQIHWYGDLRTVPIKESEPKK